MRISILLLVSLLIASCSHTPSNTPKANAPRTPLTHYISTAPVRGLALSERLDKIGFGSCTNQDQPQPIWDTIAKENLNLFVTMGDNVYASLPHQQPIAEQYYKQDQVANYRDLRLKVPFMATWDDHDFGLRDGGASWAQKEAAQKDFLNYWTYIRHSIPLDQKGIYHSKIIGPFNEMVQIIMLDTRYFRSDLVEREDLKGRFFDYAPNNTGTVLGEKQWKWLEEELKKPANIRFIVSSIQVIANEPRFEKWGNFPKERQRLFDLIERTKADNVFLLSGDRHIASISKIELPKYGPLYEITSSALNQPNEYPDNDTHYIGQSYNKENYAVAQIDWDKKQIEFTVRDIKGEVVNNISAPFKWSYQKPPKEKPERKRRSKKRRR